MEAPVSSTATFTHQSLTTAVSGACVRTSVCPCGRSFDHSFFRSLVLSFVRSFVRSFVHSFVFWPSNRSFARSLVRSLFDHACVDHGLRSFRLLQVRIVQHHAVCWATLHARRIRTVGRDAGDVCLGGSCVTVNVRQKLPQREGACNSTDPDDKSCGS